MKNYFLLILFLSVGLSSYGQYRISGYIEDASTREKLYGATVVMKGTTKGTTSNFYGYFSFPVDVKDVEIIFSFVGYQSQTLSFQLAGDTSVVIALNPSVELKAVVVESEREEAIELRPQVSSISIPSKQLMQLPAVAGEIDLLRALQLLPGVQSGKEGQTGLYVRGGGPDQNLILMDGVPLYSVSHLGGLFSVFNPDIVSDVNLIKGGFPARYGGRLSSVINVKVKDGNREERHTSGAIGLLSSRLTTEGPINKGKGSYMVGGRRTYLDLFTRPISKSASGGEYSVGYLFYDLNGKINYDFTDKDKVFLSIYSGDDKAILKSDTREDESRSRLVWGNLLGTVKWNHLFSDKWFTNLTLNYTRYRYLLDYNMKNKQDESSQFFKYFSGIEDLGLRYEAEYYLNQQHNFLTGIQYTEHFFTPGINAYKSNEGENGQRQDTTYGSFNVNSREISWYFEDQWNISKRVKLNAGIHLNAYNVDRSLYMGPQPRATLRVLTGRYSSVKLSYAAMQQNVHLLSTSGVGLPTDLWVPATENVKPQRSYQWTAAFSQTLPRGFEFSTEVYYKEMKDLIAYSEGENWLAGTTDWQEKIEDGGEGWSKGLEVFLHKKEGRFTGWIGYTLSKTDRQFDGINFGKKFAYRYDRRHDIGILMTYKINDRIDISATWVYGTGNAITLGEGKYLAVPYRLPDLAGGDYPSRNYNPEVEIYQGRNAYRMKAYHRSDFGVRFTKQKKWGERTWNIGFYNVYNRANPFYYYWANDYNLRTHTYKRVLKQIALFPIIPAFSYEFKF